MLNFVTDLSYDLICCWKIKMKKFDWAWTQFSVRHSCTQVACSHKFRPIELRRSLRFSFSLHARARENLLASSLTHYNMGNHIYTPTNLYNFPI